MKTKTTRQKQYFLTSKSDLLAIFLTLESKGLLDAKITGNLFVKYFKSFKYKIPIAPKIPKSLTKYLSQVNL